MMEKQKKRAVKTKGSPTLVDQHVGNRLRKRRTFLGWSQEKLADAVDVTFQQVQKYEKGMNRISASRLFQFAGVLDVPVSYFFEEFAVKDHHMANLPGLGDTSQAEFQGSDVFDRKETIELIRTYYSIGDAKLRKDLFRLIKSMADNINNNN